MRKDILNYDMKKRNFLIVSIVIMMVIMFISLSNMTVYAETIKAIKTQPSTSNNYTIEINDNYPDHVTFQWYKVTSGTEWVQSSYYYSNYSNGGTRGAGESAPLSNSQQGCYLEVGSNVESLRFQLTGTGTITNCTVSQDGYYYPPSRTDKNNIYKYFDITGQNPNVDSWMTNIEVLVDTHTILSGETSAKLQNATESGEYVCYVMDGLDVVAISDYIQIVSSQSATENGSSDTGVIANNNAGTAQTVNKTSAKTTDSSNIYFWIVIMVFGLAIIVYTMSTDKNNKKA